MAHPPPPNQISDVTPVTSRLLEYWRNHSFENVRPFFCQIEAVETIIWLTEVAPKKQKFSKFWKHIRNANVAANPELLRVATKMATGAGKTTVMAMLIAWQAINAARYPNSRIFTNGFLIVTPGITIKDRLRVLKPSDPLSYYDSRELVPKDMLEDLSRAKVVVTNFHAFQRRENQNISNTTKSILQGHGKPIQTKETDGQMVRRVAAELMGKKNIIVFNDEAHHCYHENPNKQNQKLAQDERNEAKENNQAARIWINGIETFRRTIGVKTVYDLSATPFFLSGSGWAEGTLFPWTVSDFSLMDAIECGIVKLPRVPIDDNDHASNDMPVFRDLWKHIGKKLPKQGGLNVNPKEIPDKLQSALQSLYGHYEKVAEQWEKSGVQVPPVFIVVSNNTTTSKMIYEWISGWQRKNEDGEVATAHKGHLKRFSNFNDFYEPLAHPKTILIDSRQIEGGALDSKFRKLAEKQIEIFKQQRAQRGDYSGITDSELLREVMNTVGKEGALGEQIRCVVSVAMLTEGWDANTVTHILGVRAFGTQLLCEQVVGRGLRRLNYELNKDGKFDSEYVDILGIPFDFATKPVVAPVKVPRVTRRVKALPERRHLEITFPRVVGYRIRLPDEHLEAKFTPESTYVISHELVGASQTDMAGIVGESHQLTLDQAQKLRPSKIVIHLAKSVLERHFLDGNHEPKLHLFEDIKSICRRWFDEGFLKCPGNTHPWMVCFYPEITRQAAEKIVTAIIRADPEEKRIKVILDPFKQTGSTSNINFDTSKKVVDTSPSKCHVNRVVLDSDWEAEFVRVAENNPHVISYVKNHNMEFSIPYQDGETSREYLPDFIARVKTNSSDEELVSIIVEIKGMKNEKVKLKKETIEEKWIPGVNAMGKFGRWRFIQIEEKHEIEPEFNLLVDSIVNQSEKS